MYLNLATEFITYCIDLLAIMIPTHLITRMMHNFEIEIEKISNLLMI